MTAWDFSKAVVPVTGAASGIGFEIARRLKAEGATPLLLDIDAARLAEAAQAIHAGADDPGRFAYTVDVASSDSVNDTFDRIARDHGGITHLVSNAGINKPTNSLDVSDEDWNRIISINLSGQMFVCRAGGRLLTRSGGGAIVTVASISGVFGKKNRVAYNASKGGVVNLTRALALDLGEHAIRVNAVAPGIIITPQQVYNSPEYMQNMASRAALGRTGTPDDIASVALFLLSDLAAFVTGQTLVVDGGLTLSYA